MSHGLDCIYGKILSLYLSQVFGFLFVHQKTGDSLPLCRHIKGGHKSAVRDVFAVKDNYKFCYKTDVENYYSSIDHEILLRQIYSLTHNEKLVITLRKFLTRARDIDGAMYIDITKGLIKGCSLSPVLGCIYLSILDREFAQRGEEVFYIRFQDDILFMTNSRYLLKRLIKRMYGVLDGLSLKLRPEKTDLSHL